MTPLADRPRLHRPGQPRLRLARAARRAYASRPARSRSPAISASPNPAAASCAATIPPPAAGIRATSPRSPRRAACPTSRPISSMPTSPAPPRPVGGLTVVAFPNNHLVYMLTWFALAAMTIGAFVVFVRQDARKRRRADMTLDDGGHARAGSAGSRSPQRAPTRPATPTCSSWSRCAGSRSPGSSSTILFARFALGIRPAAGADAGGAGGGWSRSTSPACRSTAGARARTSSCCSRCCSTSACSTAQLYLSGGATNPFISLFLLQVVLGAVLLDRWSSWAIVAVTAALFRACSRCYYRPLDPAARLQRRVCSLLCTIGSLLCFVLIATLLVLFVTRITGNLRAPRRAPRRPAPAGGRGGPYRPHGPARVRRRARTRHAAVVAVGDPRRLAPHADARAATPTCQAEIVEMQAEVQRCKAIVTGILLSAGEARGEAPEISRSTASSTASSPTGARRTPASRSTMPTRVGDDPQIVVRPRAANR